MVDFWLTNNTTFMQTWHLIFSFSKIPWTEEPGRLKSMGSRKVRHD